MGVPFIGARGWLAGWSAARQPLRLQPSQAQLGSVNSDSLQRASSRENNLRPSQNPCYIRKCVLFPSLPFFLLFHDFGALFSLVEANSPLLTPPRGADVWMVLWWAYEGSAPQIAAVLQRGRGEASAPGKERSSIRREIEGGTSVWGTQRVSME